MPRCHVSFRQWIPLVEPGWRMACRCWGLDVGWSFSMVGWRCFNVNHPQTLENSRLEPLKLSRYEIVDLQKKFPQNKGKDEWHLEIYWYVLKIYENIRVATTLAARMSIWQTAQKWNGPIPKNPWDVMGCQNHLFWGPRDVIRRVWCFHRKGSGSLGIYSLLALTIKDGKSLKLFHNLIFYNLTKSIQVLISIASPHFGPGLLIGAHKKAWDPYDSGWFTR